MDIVTSISATERDELGDILALSIALMRMQDILERRLARRLGVENSALGDYVSEAVVHAWPMDVLLTNLAIRVREP